MTTDITTTPAEQSVELTQAEQTLMTIDAVVKECTLASIIKMDAVAQALKLAAGVAQLNSLITDEMMNNIMQLQNSAIGFLTDRDPATAKPGERIEPYGVDVVKRCFIESLFRGVRPVNNEWNILARRCYVTKNGFSRLVREWPGVSNIVLSPAAPVMSPSGATAAVPYVITWTVTEGQQQRAESLELIWNDDQHDNRIIVRCNKGMGMDAILGKAERKALARVYSVLSGRDIPEGDVGDTTPEATGMIGNAAKAPKMTEAPTPGRSLNDVGARQSSIGDAALEFAACDHPVDVEAVAKKYAAMDPTPQEQTVLKGLQESRLREIEQTPPDDTPPPSGSPPQPSAAGSGNETPRVAKLISEIAAAGTRKEVTIIMNKARGVGLTQAETTALSAMANRKLATFQG